MIMIKIALSRLLIGLCSISNNLQRDIEIWKKVQKGNRDCK